MDRGTDRQTDGQELNIMPRLSSRIIDQHCASPQTESGHFAILLGNDLLWDDQFQRD